MAPHSGSVREQTPAVHRNTIDEFQAGDKALRKGVLNRREYLLDQLWCPLGERERWHSDQVVTPTHFTPNYDRSSDSSRLWRHRRSTQYLSLDKALCIVDRASCARHAAAHTSLVLTVNIVQRSKERTLHISLHTAGHRRDNIRIVMIGAQWLIDVNAAMSMGWQDGNERLAQAIRFAVRPQWYQT